MGEKIRDIRPVNLIGNDLMVELNEGYTKSQGRVIHIQNSKFRYLLTEDDFYAVASDIMRAAVELDYIKTHLPQPDIAVPAGEEASALKEFGFLQDLTDSEVEYRILGIRNHVLTLLVRPECYKMFRKYAKKERLKKLEHPFGKRHGYRFLYQMHEFEMYEKNGYYYEIMCQLPCKSLTPKMWMPLDKCVQKALWTDKRMIEGYPYVADEEMWIYRMTSCMFTRMDITPEDRTFFEENRGVLSSESLRQKLLLIVFGFADTLLELARERDYGHIIEKYYSYADY
ncbi:MAG: hypothetical protein NC124_00030 [Clostridium sp.]|nr:hypothetical protein [Clostridium sp.]